MFKKDVFVSDVRGGKTLIDLKPSAYKRIFAAVWWLATLISQPIAGCSRNRSGRKSQSLSRNLASSRNEESCRGCHALEQISYTATLNTLSRPAGAGRLHTLGLQPWKSRRIFPVPTGLTGVPVIRDLLLSPARYLYRLSAAPIARAGLGVPFRCCCGRTKASTAP